jgi:hypothetical protein
MDQILEQIRDWADIEPKWWQHLLGKNFSCKCVKYDPVSEDGPWYCAEFEAIQAVEVARVLLEKKLAELQFIQDHNGMTPHEWEKHDADKLVE